MGAYTYSGTAASNTAVDGIGAQGSDSPDNIDNLVRALAASDANLVRDLGGANTVAGTADAITVALADATAATAYFDGMIFSFRAGSDNATTTPTLNVDSIGAKTIKKAVAGVQSALVAGDIQAGGTYTVVYRSAWASAAGAFELLNPHFHNPIPATAVEQETATATDRYVAPATQHRHPSAAKVWGTTSGGGTPQLETSYNMDSITDTNTGRLTVTFVTAFSASTYGGAASTVTSSNAARICCLVTRSTGSIILESSSASGTLADPSGGYTWAFFGDHE